MSTNRRNRSQSSAARRVAGTRKRQDEAQPRPDERGAEQSPGSENAPPEWGADLSSDSAPKSSAATSTEAELDTGSPLDGASGSSGVAGGASAPDDGAPEDGAPDDAASDDGAVADGETADSDIVDGDTADGDTADGSAGTDTTAAPAAADVPQARSKRQRTRDNAHAAEDASGGARTTSGHSNRLRASVQFGSHWRTASEYDTSTGAGADLDGDSAASAKPAGRWRLRHWQPSGRAVLAMGIITVLTLGFSGWFGYEAYALRYTGPAANQAMTDNATTSEVNGQVSDAVEKVFSYDFNDTDKSAQAAKKLLTGPAVQTYDDLFRVVKKQAPKQQLVVTATVRNSVVTHLDGDRAEVLLFVDQRSMRANTGQSNVGPAQLTVGAKHEDDTWKINQITLR